MSGVGTIGAPSNICAGMRCDISVCVCEYKSEDLRPGVSRRRKLDDEKVDKTGEKHQHGATESEYKLNSENKRNLNPCSESWRAGQDTRAHDEGVNY